MQEQISCMKSEFFKALAHPTRIRILEQLLNGEVCVCDLVPELGLEQSNVSQHLAVLRKQNIIVSRKVGLQVLYSLKYPAVQEVLKKVQEILSQQLQESEALRQHLAEIEIKPKTASKANN